MKSTISLLLFVLLGCPLAAQQTTFTIGHLSDAPVIDGELSEPVWESAQTINSFTTFLPQPGNTPQQATEVKMGYTDLGIYIAAVCMSNHIRRDGSIRDEKGPGDYLSVGFDTWNDDQYAFVFTVGASGQRTEERISSNQTEPGFDTPWLARTSIQANSWTAEIFIPFRSMRYQRDGMQNWGIQFTRFDRNTGETSTWSPQNPLIEDIVWQYGNLEGLNIVKQKERFGITNQSTYHKDWYRQYLISNDSNYYENKFAGIDKAQSRLDGRWGPSPNTTIDLSLVPTLEWDNYLLYDSPLASAGIARTRYPYSPDHRPLVMEENSLFNKTTPLRFVNGIPFGDFISYAGITLPARLSNYDGGQLVNHIKVAARPSKNLSIGVSNAIYSQMRETYNNFSTGESFSLTTNKYPVLNQVSIERVFRNNSWIQVSNLHEFIKSPYAFNIASAAGQWRDKSNQYELSGKLDMETIQTTGSYSRLRGRASIRKINGIWVWNANYTSYGQRYNPDYNASDPLDQKHIVQGSIGKRNFHPVNSNWLNTTKGIYSICYADNQTQKPEDLTVSAYWSGLNKRYNRVEASAGFKVIKQKQFLFLPESNIAREVPPSVVLSGKWASDERKRLWIDVNGSVEKSLRKVEDTWRSFGQIRYIPHPKWRLSASWSYYLETNYPNALNEFSLQYGVEKSNRQDIFMDANIWFMPIPKLAVGAGISHSRFRIDNKRAFVLVDNGNLQPVDFTFIGNPNKENTKPELFLAWYISPLRQIKLSWQNNRDVVHQFSTPALIDFDFHNHTSTLNISAIFSFYN